MMTFKKKEKKTKPNQKKHKKQRLDVVHLLRKWKKWCNDRELDTLCSVRMLTYRSLRSAISFHCRTALFSAAAFAADVVVGFVENSTRTEISHSNGSSQSARKIQLSNCNNWFRWHFFCCVSISRFLIVIGNLKVSISKIGWCEMSFH